MTKSDFKKWHQMGISRDLAYQLAAGNHGLFGKAYFGHKATKKERQKLNRIWAIICEIWEH